MTTAPATRVADYFFVAGLHDNHIMPAFEYARKHNSKNTAESDVLYYQQQEEAIANIDNNVNNGDIPSVSELPPDSNNSMTMPFQPRRRGYSVNHMSTMQSASLDSSKSASLLGVLDHVQHIIDHFDKERDSAREDVISVQDPATMNNRRSSDRATVFDIGRSKSSPIDKFTKRMSLIEVSTPSSRKWRSPSDPKLQTNEFKRHSVSMEDSKSSDRVPNIFDIKYTPTVLMKYPKLHNATIEPFPAYAAMFCFPKDIKLYCGDAPPPPEQAHSFTITDENGSTMCGTCIVFYEKLTDRLKTPVNKAIQEWVRANLDQNTVEYAQHLKNKIKAEKEQLEQARKDQAQLTSLQSDRRRSSEIEEIIRTCLENINLYRELLEPVKMGISTADDVWVPKAIGLLGRMSWMNLYSDWLKILLDNIVGVAGHRNAKPTIDIESTVINLIDETPLPPPGRFEIGLTINGKSLFFSRPPVNQVPILKDFSLYPLFRALSPHLILAVLETLLSEGKVIFLSQYTGMLSFACESFRYLLFPFYWQFVYIPVLPERLLTCLQAPVPYMIGFRGTVDELEDYVPEDACIVNLDSNTMRQSERAMTIPDRQRRKLQAALEQYAPLHTKCRISYGIPLPVQCVYPKGKMVLNCNRSKSTDKFISPAKPRDSISSDTTSILSLTGSLISKPSEFLSMVGSHSSIESASSDALNNTHPQLPGSAMLSTSAGNYASSLHNSSPPISPLRKVPSVQSNLSRNSPKLQRMSIPTPIVTTASSPSSSALESPDVYTNNKASFRRSEPISMKPSAQDNSRNRISDSLSKSRSMIFSGDHNYNDLNTVATSPRISISTPRSSTTGFDHGYHNQVPRRIRHIEGHVMAEIFVSELHRFQGYRCVCGKPVSEDEDRSASKMFMCCQECHLVTHNACTNQILHPCLPACFDETEVHEAFLRMFASLLYNYRNGFVDSLENTSEPSIKADGILKKNMLFSKDKFIKHSDKDTRGFLSNLMNSQMFTQFITDRLIKSPQEPEILLFDEYIKLKLNRSKFKLVKEDTPFLNDSSYKVSQIIWSTPPQEPRVLSQGDCKRFPTKLQFFSNE